ncbi:hypothetical protein ACLOJK_001017 [Asimina triloba]
MRDRGDGSNRYKLLRDDDQADGCNSMVTEEMTTNGSDGRRQRWTTEIEMLMHDGSDGQRQRWTTETKTKMHDGDGDG